MVDLRAVTVTYKRKKVLNQVSFCFGEKTYVLLGPNGSGKTTLFRCITHNIGNYQGEILFGKLSRPLIGYLPQFFGPFYDLTVEETLDYLAMYKRQGVEKQEVNKVIDLFELNEIKSQRMKKLSGGIIRKIGIAQAFMGNPDIILLDEPAIGLDPEERKKFFEILKKISYDKTMIISTHILEDAYKISDEAVIINEGDISSETLNTYHEEFEEKCLRFFK